MNSYASYNIRYDNTLILYIRPTPPPPRLSRSIICYDRYNIMLYCVPVVAEKKNKTKLHRAERTSHTRECGHHNHVCYTYWRSKIKPTHIYYQHGRRIYVYIYIVCVCVNSIPTDADKNRIINDIGQTEHKKKKKPRDRAAVVLGIFSVGHNERFSRHTLFSCNTQITLFPVKRIWTITVCKRFHSIKWRIYTNTIIMYILYILYTLHIYIYIYRTYYIIFIHNIILYYRWAIDIIIYLSW